MLLVVWCKLIDISAGSLSLFFCIKLVELFGKFWNLGIKWSPFFESFYKAGIDGFWNYDASLFLRFFWNCRFFLSGYPGVINYRFWTNVSRMLLLFLRWFLRGSVIVTEYSSSEYGAVWIFYSIFLATILAITLLLYFWEGTTLELLLEIWIVFSLSSLTSIGLVTLLEFWIAATFLFRYYAEFIYYKLLFNL